MYRRAVLKEIKTDFEIIEESLPSVGDDDVLIELEAAALNRRDYWITQGLYPGLQLPCTPGSDAAGRVISCGSNVQNVTIGEEVIINPANNWGDVEEAQDKSFHVLGMPSIGTHASHICVAADRIHKKPEHLNWQEAAALPLAYATAYRALAVQGKAQTGQHILVTGIGGGVAVAVLQIAKAIGCEVLVTTSDPKKGELAKELGAAAYYNYKEDDWSKQLIKTHGSVDVMIDGSGGANYSAAMNALKPGGRMVVYGATAGPPPKMDVFKLFWKQIHVIGSTMASDADFENMIQLVNEHKIKSIIDAQFTLTDINMAYAQQASSERMGKIVVLCKE